MENWIFYGIIAAVCFGLNTVIYKIASQKSGFSPYYGSFVFALGIIIAFGLFFLLRPSNDFEWKSTSLLVIAGVVWAIGFIAIAIAISQKADVSRLAPIYNANTLITVALGIFLLHEIPDASQMIRVIGGSVLIVIGAILVSI